MAFKMNGMDFGQGVRQPQGGMSDPNASMGGGVFKKHPLHMLNNYNSPNDLQEKGSPTKALPAVGYGLSLLGGVILRKGGQFLAKKGIKKLVKRNVKKNLQKNITKGLNVTQRQSKGAKYLKKAADYTFGTTRLGKFASTVGFATMIPGGKIAQSIFGGGKKPETYDPTKDTKPKKKKPNVKYTRAKTKDPNLDKYIKQRKIHPKGSEGYNIAQNRINLAYGVSKRHGVKTTKDTSGRKIKTSTYVPGISKQQTAANKRRNKTVTLNQNLMTGATTKIKTKANKTKTTLRTGGMVVKKKTRGGKTVIKTRRQGSIFGKRKRIS